MKADQPPIDEPSITNETASQQTDVILDVPKTLEGEAPSYDQILALIGVEGGLTEKVRVAYGKWLDQEQTLIQSSSDTGSAEARKNLKEADIYVALGDIDGALQSLEETIAQIEGELIEARKIGSKRYSTEAQRVIAELSYRNLFNEIADKIETIEKMKGE